MAGQNLTPDQIAAAAAVQPGAASQQQAVPNQQPTSAAAQQQAAPGNPAQPPAQNPPAPQMLTQEQADAIFNKRWGEKMADLEKELGIQPGGLKEYLAAQKKPKTPPAGATEPLTGAELRMAKMEALMLAGVPSKKIPGLLSRVQGKTKADIEADVQFMLTEGFIILEAPLAAQPQQQPQNQAQGAGQQGVPVTPGKKVWKQSEIAGMSHVDRIKHKDEILQAINEGRVVEG